MELVVDTNIIFSALIGTKMKDTLSTALIVVELHTVSELLEELEQHWNKILRYTHLPEQLLDKFYNIIINTITIHPIDTIPADTIRKARELAEEFHPDDWPFIALAMHLNAPLWTGDKGILELSMRINYKHYTAIDTEGVKMLLEGKSIEEVKERMREKYGGTI